MALVHHPVIDKNKETIASAVTNLDLHDIARACRTYGVKGYFVVTPLADQMELAKRIVEHWTIGFGGTYNPQRKEALALVRVTARFEDAMDEITAMEGVRPKTVVTSARDCPGSLACSTFRHMLEETAPYLLVFGTAWGLTDAFMEEGDYRLAPLTGAGTYNHLSVRSAVSIILDRLLGVAKGK